MGIQMDELAASNAWLPSRTFWRPWPVTCPTRERTPGRCGSARGRLLAGERLHAGRRVRRRGRYSRPEGRRRIITPLPGSFSMASGIFQNLGSRSSTMAFVSRSWTWTGAGSTRSWSCHLPQSPRYSRVTISAFERSRRSTYQSSSGPSREAMRPIHLGIGLLMSFADYGRNRSAGSGWTTSWCRSRFPRPARSAVLNWAEARDCMVFRGQ